VREGGNEAKRGNYWRLTRQIELEWRQSERQVERRRWRADAKADRKWESCRIEVIESVSSSRNTNRKCDWTEIWRRATRNHDRTLVEGGGVKVAGTSATEQVKQVTRAATVTRYWSQDHQSVRGSGLGGRWSV
jgi:hypothetical protein